LSLQAFQRIQTLEAKWQQYEVQLKLSVIQRAAERALAVRQESWQTYYQN
jgi:hypothetical protein